MVCAIPFVVSSVKDTFSNITIKGNPARDCLLYLLVFQVIICSEVSFHSE
jgi:hypothetical protein